MRSGNATLQQSSLAYGEIQENTREYWQLCKDTFDMIVTIQQVVYSTSDPRVDILVTDEALASA